MFSRKYFFLLIICLVFKVYPQSNSTIEGIITNTNSEPLENINILVQELNTGTASDKYGRYKLVLPDGEYTLIVSSVGYKTESETVSLKENDHLRLNFILQEDEIEIDNVVVTGTRTEKNLSTSPIKTELISAAKIERSAFTRLNDVLNEETGISVVDEPWGKGVQLQGLDPAYTLILLDGEPLIGRPGGTLELTRFSVADLKQVEIVKGASSSLYGSEALAGVINLITEIPDEPYNLRFQSYYKTHNTIDFSARALINNDDLGASIYLNRLSSDGYKLFLNSLSLTAPEFSSYTINPKVNYNLGSNSKIKYSGRFFLEEQLNRFQLSLNQNEYLINTKDELTDWTNNLSLEHKFNNVFKSEVKFNLSGFLSESNSVYNETGSVYEKSKFNQYFYKAELKNDIILGKNYIVAGGGYSTESVDADRIHHGEKSTQSYFIYLQDEWVPDNTFDIVGGVRYDWHSEYEARLSPKLSVLVKPLNILKIRGSFGTGFKAPTLQQLYLDFTNPQAGYSIFGSSNIIESFAALQAQGQIQRILIDPNSLEKIKAENSIAFNFGIELTPFEFLHASINFFRNNVKDLIEAIPIAVKTNGQSVFTYFNLNKIYTQGFETGISIDILDDFNFSIGYQYLEAIDENVLNKVRNGEISKVGSNGLIRPVQEVEYGGLFNRSKHSGTIKFYYHNKSLGFDAGLRGIIRGKYGFGDTNGNSILDDKSEYVPGYAVWNLTISKEIAEYFNLQFGLENIFDKTIPEFIPSMPGRIIYGGIHFSLK